MPATTSRTGPCIRYFNSCSNCTFKAFYPLLATFFKHLSRKQLENAIAADSNVRFYILFIVAGGAMVVLAVLWHLIVDPDHAHTDTADIWYPPLA